MINSNEISCKTVVITGAAGVLCGKFSRELCARGAKVALLDINEAKAKALEEELVNNGGDAFAVGCNVLDKKSLEAAREAVKAKYGECDILINGAGGNNPRATTSKEYFEPGDDLDSDVKSFFDLDPDGVGFVFDLNFKGALLTTQAFAKGMLNRGCSIINISSMNAYRPLTKIPAYSAAKAAVSNFTMWLAVHFSRCDLRVNAIAPGFFITEQNRTLLLNEDGSYTKRSEKILNATPVNRFGEPDELIGTLLYLCDNGASGFVNGVVIPVDGGFSAYSGV